MTEKLLYTQSSKRDLHVIRQDREKSIGLGPAALGKLCKEEKVCKGRPLTLGSKQVSGIPVLGSCMERQAHLLTGKPTKSDDRAGEA